jgi:propionate CoA-transferase
VDKLVRKPTRPRNAIIPGCLVDAIVVVEQEPLGSGYEALTGSFEIPSGQWDMWVEIIDRMSASERKNSVIADIIGRRASQELHEGDIVNIGVRIPEYVSRYAKESGMLNKITLTVESGGVGGFPASGPVFGAMIGAASVYDMANQFDLYDNGGLDICFMGALEVDKYGNVNAHRGIGSYSGIGGFANITAKTPLVVFCLSFTAKGLFVEEEYGKINIVQEGRVPKFVEKVSSISFSAKRALENGQRASPDSLLSGAGALREGDRIAKAAGTALLSIGANWILQGRAHSKERGEQ